MCPWAAKRDCRGQGPLGTGLPGRAQGSRGQRSCRAPRTEIKPRVGSVGELSVTGTLVFSELGGADNLRHEKKRRCFSSLWHVGSGGNTDTAHGHWALAAPSQPVLSDSQRF